MERSDQQYDAQYKLLLIGDSSVGKTSLLYRYASGEFQNNYGYTIGTDFKIKSIQLNKKKVKLQIWDTAGQERFLKLTRSCFRGSGTIIVCYDVTDSASYRSVKSWVKDVRTNAEADVNIIIAACKADCEHDIDINEARDMAMDLGCDLFEVSAKTGSGVEDLFTAATAPLRKRLEAQSEPKGVILDEVVVSGATSWCNKNRINGRYVPAPLGNGKQGLRNIDAPGSEMHRQDGMWMVQTGRRVLARLKSTNPAPVSTAGWEENSGYFITWFFAQPEMKCVLYTQPSQDVPEKDLFSQNDGGLINMDKFVQYSKEPEQLGLTIPLFVRYCAIKVAILELEFRSMKAALDVQAMDALREQKLRVEQTCKQLVSSANFSAQGNNSQIPPSVEKPAAEALGAVEVTAPAVTTALTKFLQELAAHFDSLCDINKGNFGAARRCRDTMQALEADLARLTLPSPSPAEPASTVSATSPVLIPPTPPALLQGADSRVDECDNVLVSSSLSSVSTNTTAAEVRQAMSAHTGEGSHSSAQQQLATRVAHDVKHKWTCTVDSVGWVVVHERENHTSAEIEWRCTVSSGVTNTTSTEVGAALSAGMAGICAQLSLDARWSSSASRSTEHEHVLKIPPHSKLTVEQEVIEGSITFSNKGVLHLGGKKKAEKFRVAKDSLRILPSSL